MKKILIVDDDAELRSHLSEVLKEKGYQIDSAASAIEACEKLALVEFDVVLLDYMMPKKKGIEALVDIRSLRPRVKVIMITAFASIENAIDAIKGGVSDYVSKPFIMDSLLLAIGRVLEEAKFEESVKQMDLDQTFGTLANPIRRNILKLLQRNKGARLMDITRNLGIEDHTKVVFHLKMLKEAGIIDQNIGKGYVLSEEGVRINDCLKTLERFLTS